MIDTPEERVHLVQLLCPRRHCILATAYHPSGGNKDEAIAQLDAQRARLGLNPWCGICGSRDLVYEDRGTPFLTLDEALPALREQEQANIQSRAHLDAMGVSYDSQPRN